MHLLHWFCKVPSKVPKTYCHTLNTSIEPTNIKLHVIIWTNWFQSLMHVAFVQVKYVDGIELQYPNSYFKVCILDLNYFCGLSSISNPQIFFFVKFIHALIETKIFPLGIRCKIGLFNVTISAEFDLSIFSWWNRYMKAVWKKEFST